MALKKVKSTGSFREIPYDGQETVLKATPLYLCIPKDVEAGVTSVKEGQTKSSDTFQDRESFLSMSVFPNENLNSRFCSNKVIIVVIHINYIIVILVISAKVLSAPRRRITSQRSNNKHLFSSSN